MLKIITTSDGSHSLLNEELNETYHSVHGALRESQHVFIEHGLAYFAQRNHLPLSVFEVGFGTGLNALLTFQYARQFQRSIHYNSIEPATLPKEVWSKLNYAASLNGLEEFKALHLGLWDIEKMLDPNFTFTKLRITLQEIEVEPSTWDVVYFDAFAPSKQPELWSVPLLGKVLQGLTPGGLMVTYCAKGQLKRDLKSLGFSVETLPGPPGKKEMVRAIKP